MYLITYSRADCSKFPSRESFASAVVEAWRNFSVRILQWVVSIEAHSTPTGSAACEEMNRYHFHMAVKLAKKARWLQVRNYLDDKFGIKVNFTDSDSQGTYFSAYRYVTKDDNEALHSPGHPDLTDDTPRTESAINSRKRKAKGVKGNRKKVKCPRLSVYDVCQIIQAKGITSRLQLVCLAVQQNREGKRSLAQFVANRGSKAVDEAIALASEFATAESLYERSQKTRIQLLREEMAHDCADGCEGKWLEAANQLLQRQGIVKGDFCGAIYTALLKGRGKYRNVFIHGDTNCGKSFILSPLKTIYKTFCNPATGSFAWIGAENAEVILLNDFRWHPRVIAWSDFLLALEGDVVHLPLPKNSSTRDLELTKDTPFFATSDAPLVLVKCGSIDTTNTDMMNVRWQFFRFSNPLRKEEQQDLSPCGRCFATFIISNTRQEDLRE